MTEIKKRMREGKSKLTFAAGMIWNAIMHKKIEIVVLMQAEN